MHFDSEHTTPPLFEAAAEQVDPPKPKEAVHGLFFVQVASTALSGLMSVLDFELMMTIGFDR